jgi:hypothetical protein
METKSANPVQQGRLTKFDIFIQKWKEEKRKEEAEAKERYKTPEYQAILKELRKKNAARGIIIPSI